MKTKTIVLIAISAVLIFACAFVAAFVMVPGFAYNLMSFARPAPAQEYGYGQGGGRGMMGGYANGTPVAPNNNAPSSSAPSSQQTGPGRGRGMMGGNSNQPAGNLVAVSADGKTIATPNGVTLPEGTAMQIAGKTNVTLAITPYPPVSFQTGNFNITLKDDKGQAITDAKISLDLTMPGMWMPPSKPTAQSAGDGNYKASAPWTMRGLWRIEVIIERGGEKTSALFDVTL
jgi:hypothetical protein